MICNQCLVEMTLVTTIQGNYNICKICNNIDFAYDDEDLDYVATRGRD